MSVKESIKLLKRMDWVLFAVMVVMAVGSVIFIYSASYRGADVPMPNYYRMQIVWLSLGFFIYLLVSIIDYRVICQWASLWYVLAIGSLVLVLIVGKTVNGSRSWLGFVGLGIQPAEFAKVGTIIAISYFLFHRTPEMRRHWRTMLGGMVLIGAPLALILAQPDLGSAIVLIPICFGLMFVSGINLKHLLVVILLGLSLAPIAWFSLKDYQKDRLTVFLDPERDPLGAGWNLNQSLIAVGSGGLTGKGYLQGTQNLLGYLPRTVAPNDFLFSVIAEEKGFVGSTCVLCLYGIILFSGLRIASSARDRLGMLLATGVVAMLFFHVVVNVGMTIGLMPITGLPLPLLSYGGSFVLATMTAIGLLQNVWIHRRIY